jgi:hypothetical protein
MKKLAPAKETLRVLEATEPAALQGAGYPTRSGPCLTAEACQILTYQLGRTLEAM